MPDGALATYFASRFLCPTSGSPCHGHRLVATRNGQRLMGRLSTYFASRFLGPTSGSPCHGSRLVAPRSGHSAWYLVVTRQPGARGDFCVRHV